LIAAEGRRHDEDRQEERDADQHLVRRARGRAETGPDEAEHDQDSGEARDREQQSRDQRDPGDQQQQLYRVAAVDPSRSYRRRAQVVERLLCYCDGRRLSAVGWGGA